MSHLPEEDVPKINTREDIIWALNDVWLGDYIIAEPPDYESMIWYRELTSRSESHPDNRARIVQSLLALNGAETEEDAIFEQYIKDYSAFYDSEKPCIGKITLKSWPLFVRFGANERKQFQDIVGLIPEELLDRSLPDDIFLYSMCEVA